MRLSPYRLDVGRLLTLALKPNLGYARPSAPDDDIFPQSGLMQIAGAVPVEWCDEAIRDHTQFEALQERRNCVIRDSQGRNYRLANFHLKSDALLRIGLSKRFHQPVSQFFRRTSSIYTSLFYKHGSQQSGHIDTPFFWTRPFNLFVGVWVALEDIRPGSGPLFYYPGSHRLFNSEAALKEMHARAGGDVQAMFALMRAEVEKTIRPVEMLLRKGDAVIWHPGIMHGGSPALDPQLTRYSMVFHFAPVGVNVRHDVFPRDFRNVPTYGLRRKHGQYYCRAALPAVMV